MLDLTQIYVKDSVCDKYSPRLFDPVAHTQTTMASFVSSTMASTTTSSQQTLASTQPSLSSHS